ncbi:MAG: glycosyl hydrolase [Cytophagales bacterium]|nr:glycosyl hydrolase [Bernardetiaceae bacterium]MDW8205973.1 glycosyl hydrolase [Cytophagales bacterium]
MKLFQTPSFVLRLVLLSTLLWLDTAVQGQRKTQNTTSALPVATSAARRIEAFKIRKQLQESSIVANVAFKNIGPTVMSGRVTDIDVCPADPSHFLVAYASGGLWHTSSNGTTMKPLFDNQASMTIGDIAVQWQGTTPAIIWVGTGENNSSRSSYAGTGIYKSADGGKTWEHLGLEETHHIGRIVLHPTDPNTIWVAATGHLYSPNPERGVFKSTDGGKTWQKTLFVDNNTGAIDLVIDPTNPQVLYAAMWERSRQAWNFKGSGKGSGIYKSTDGGNTWTQLNTDGSGFPNTEGTGRIGLAIFAGNPNILYAVLDNQDSRPADQPTGREVIKPSAFRTMTAEEFAKLPDEDLQAYFERYGIPAKYTPQSVKQDIANKKYPVKALADFINANDDLFEIEVKGAEVYRSDDGGKTWRKTHDKPLDGLVFTYGYYFSQIRVDSKNPDKVYTLGVPIIKSEDGGKTWQSINGENVHADHHALWLNPTRPGHLIVGNDGGINISYDDGASWHKMNNIPVGQFYAINVDMAQPFNVYGGLQDNGVWYGPSTYRHSLDWHDSGRYPYQLIMGGDGMQVEIDTRDNSTIYTGFQFGNYFRVNTKTGERKPITPRHELGETPYRWNWQTPIHLSRHNQDVLYMGSHRFHRSLDRGETMQTLSGDLTAGGIKGNVPYGTLTTIDESPRRFGLIYVGSDDGLVHVSRDGGYTWTRISDKLPQKLWVSRVIASHHAEPRVFVSLNGYRYDHFEPYLYVSEDYGQNWTRIGTNLPAEPINVVREDPVNDQILYVGTDHGVYISFDRGISFAAMQNGLPAVAVHDLRVHPRDKQLVVGTHGRSIYMADVQHIQQLNQELITKPLHLFPIQSITASEAWGRSRNFAAPTTPERQIVFYLNYTIKNAISNIRVLSAAGTVLQELTDESEAGINVVKYDLTISEKAVADLQKELQAKAKDGKEVKIVAADNGKYYLPVGEYTIEVRAGESVVKQTLKVEAPRQGGRRSEPSPQAYEED